MSDERTIAEKLADNELLNAALARAAREARLAHARAGRPVPICPNGEIIWLTPAQIFAMYPDAAPPADTKAS
jgi:hypothetical protein